MYNLLTRDAFTPRGMMKLGFGLMHVSAEAFKLVMPRDQPAWQEFQNKLHTFDLFENVDETLQIPSQGKPNLATLVASASGLGPYSSVWATEGAGHYNAESSWRGRTKPGRLLRSQAAKALPAESLIPLHAGMGLSFACRLLDECGPRCSSATLRRVLAEFIELCLDNSRAGYEQAAYEALGLASRNLHPHLVLRIDSELGRMSEELVGYFWHGVGRALYFAPSNFLPINSAPWRAVEMARREPPHELGRLNARAGLVWSLALVNIRHPQILELLLKHHARDFRESEAFIEGLISGLVIWRDSSPNDVFIEKLCTYRPVDKALAELWARHIGTSCAGTLQRYHRVLKQGNALGRLFRYQSLTELCREVERKGSSGDGWSMRSAQTMPGADIAAGLNSGGV